MHHTNSYLMEQVGRAHQHELLVEAEQRALRRQLRGARPSWWRAAWQRLQLALRRSPVAAPVVSIESPTVACC